jgi:hypothetical protein
VSLCGREELADDLKAWLAETLSTSLALSTFARFKKSGWREAGSAELFCNSAAL